ncbi:AraC-type DNA-binding protein [Parapedobacter koreensis]|uniref:AraC-type DNA-binding protein n=2 Tax=Parapedobacter koreensis TaxID=332977 RepID=A0A1H7JQV7_9SPHI|nr:AraC-type DNA-binding protein [Parapedobacter koreensis]
MADWLFIEDVPDRYTPNYRLIEKEVAIHRKPVFLASHQLATGGLFMMNSEILFDEPLNIHTEVMGEIIASQFIFYRRASEQSKGKPNTFYGRSRHNIRYTPTTSSDHEIKKNIDYTYFLVVMSKDYYFNLIDRHSLVHEDFVKEIARGQYTSYASEDFPVTLEMRRVIDDLVNCRQHGELKRIHTEARILELLMYQLEQLNGGHDRPELYSVKGDDVMRLEQAREILKETFRHPPTQRELSRMVALNEFKLRRGFKEYFGTTVYDYVTRLRMEHARKLLMEDRMSISEVSHEVGFSHQNNFSIAFKKYFGLPPSDLAR